jgi:hypothetical protein
MVAGFAEVIESEATLAAACNHPNLLVLPFRMELIRLAAQQCNYLSDNSLRETQAFNMKTQQIGRRPPICICVYQTALVGGPEDPKSW